MSTTQTLTYSITSDNAPSPLTGRQSEVGNTETLLSQSFAAASSAAAVSGVAFATTNLQSIFLLADKDCAITFTGPGLTINLVAGVPFIWERSTGYYAIPFGANVTAATLTCTPAVNLKGRILIS